MFIFNLQSSQNNSFNLTLDTFTDYISGAVFLPDYIK